MGQERRELDLRETEPHIGIEPAGGFEIMLEQIENRDLAPWLEDAARLAQGLIRMDRVVQRLMHQDEVYLRGVDRELLHIAQPVFQIPDSVTFGEGASIL